MTRRWGFIALLIIVMGLLLACEFAVPEAPVKPPNGPTLSHPWPNEEWYQIALDQVRQTQAASFPVADGKKWCPNGMSPHAYAALVGAMAKYESSFKADTTYRENFKDKNGNWVISTGLLQLSYESARQTPYNCRGLITREEDLKNAEKNIRCAVNIIAYWLRRDGVVQDYSGGVHKGISRYWSVMRPSSSKFERVKATLAPHCH